MRSLTKAKSPTVNRFVDAHLTQCYQIPTSLRPRIEVAMRIRSQKFGTKLSCVIVVLIYSMTLNFEGGETKGWSQELFEVQISIGLLQISTLVTAHEVFLLNFAPSSPSLLKGPLK